jgi:hypothetical protein
MERSMRPQGGGDGSGLGWTGAEVSQKGSYRGEERAESKAGIDCSEAGIEVSTRPHHENGQCSPEKDRRRSSMELSTPSCYLGWSAQTTTERVGSGQ